MQKILVIGAGYSGERLALAHVERGDAVTATRRSAPEGDAAWSWLALDLDHPADGDLPLVDRVYYTAPPGREAQQDHRLRRLLEHLPGSPTFVYFSTTGVYGDVGGDRVDENAALQPANDRSRRRVAAEAQVNEWSAAHKARRVILRVAGIYGPGRLPEKRLRDRRPVLEPSVAGYSNRIHVDDLVRAAMAAADHAEHSGKDLVLNVADGGPTTTAEYLDTAARMMDLPVPPRIDWAQAEQEFPETALSFMRDNKRVDVARLLALPGFSLLYPDFHDGLRASLEAQAKASYY